MYGACWMLLVKDQRECHRFGNMSILYVIYVIYVRWKHVHAVYVCIYCDEVSNVGEKASSRCVDIVTVRVLW